MPPGRADRRVAPDDRPVSPPESWQRSAGRWLERILLAAVLVFAIHRLGPQVAALTGIGPDLGRSPSWEFRALDGPDIRSADLEGQVVVLNFWATWCGPCRLEMPSLQSLHDDLGDAGVAVLGLSTDVGDPAIVREFLDERGIAYPVGLASVEHRRAFGGIPGIPTTFIIDRSGVVRHRVVGYFAPPALRAAVNRLLGEARARDGIVTPDPKAERWPHD